MLIIDIKTNQETTFEQFTTLQQYRTNLKVFLEEVKKNRTHQKKKIESLEKEYLQANKAVKEIFNGKRTYSSIEYKSKINKP